MPPSPKKSSPWRALVHVLWRSPLYAIPMAVFFGTIFGSGREGYVRAFKISLVFSYAMGLAYWALGQFVIPRLPWILDEKRGVLPASLLYAGVGFFASAIAASIIHLTIVPGFLGSARQIATLAMFTLLFSALGVVIAWALIFYRRAIDRAKSEEELNLARRIQRSFLLSSFPEMPRFEVHAVNISSRQVSGDFYDVVADGDHAFLLAIADVAGKGVPAALLSSMLQASLRTQANGQVPVSAILRIINTLVYRSTEVHQFATFFLARIDERRLRIAYSNAGHNHPVVFRRDGSQVPLERGGTVVGIMESTTFEEGELELRLGDRLVLYTDGISEAASPGGELFGEERLYRLVSGLPEDLSARETTERIMEGVRGFLDGTDAGDDMTLMVLRVLDAEPSLQAHAAPAAGS